MPRLPVERAYYHPYIERMSREELLALQWRRLKQLLEYAYYRVPFYRHIFQEAKLTPESIKTMEDFRKLPILGKKDMLKDQEAAPPYGQRLGVPAEKLVRFYMTSGTSGLGQEIYGLTRNDVEAATIWARGLYWMGTRRGDVFINSMPTSLGTLAAPDAISQALILMGANHIHLGITYTTEQRLQLMKRFNPSFWFGTQVKRTMIVCQQMGIDPRKDFPRLAGVPADTLTGVTVDDIREVEEFFNARSHGPYGMSQSKTSISWTCEHGNIVNGKLGMYHLWEDRFLVEVVDKQTREPVKWGEEGEAILTTLTVEASPVIRFGMNDKVVYCAPTYCDCGRPFAGIQVGSIKRYDDMMKIKGLNVWPDAVDLVIFGHREVAEYAGRVYMTEDGREEIAIKVEFKPGVTPEEKKKVLAGLSEELRRQVGLHMSVEETPQPLPRWEWKPRRWSDERLKGLQRRTL